MLIESFFGVLVEKREKQFPDGGKGWFCVFLKENDELVTAWLPSGVEGAADAEAVDVEGFRRDLALFVKVSKRIWGTDIKRTIVQLDV